MHLKILQSLLDFDPPPLPLLSRAPTPDPVEPSAVVAAAAPTAPAAPTASTATETEPPAPRDTRFQPAAAFLAPAAPAPAAPAPAAAEASEPAPRFLPAGSKPPQPRPNTNNKKTTPALRIVPRTPARNRPVLVIGTGDANSSEYNPGGFLGCVRRALDRGWDVEIAAFTSGISSLWTGEQIRRFTDDGRPRGELRVIDLAQFGEELVTV